MGSEPGRVCTDLCVLCVLIFVCFYLFCINIAFLFEKQIQLWLDLKKKVSSDFFLIVLNVVLVSGGRAPNPASL